jgi:hypothetical protein
MKVARLSCGWLVSMVAFSFLRSRALAFLPSRSRRSFTRTSMRSFNSLTPPSDLRTQGTSSCSTTSLRNGMWSPSDLRTRGASSCSTTSLRNGMWSQDDELRGSDRLKACVPYLLPLIDGDQFAHYIFLRLPVLGALNDFFLGPLLSVSHNVPFFGIGLFCAFTLGTRFNTSIDRNVRFSAQQAALIDVALIFPELIGSSTGDEPLPRALLEPCNNFIWYAYMTAVIYCVYSNLSGKKPDQIPWISAYAELMVGPM